MIQTLHIPVENYGFVALEVSGLKPHEIRDLYDSYARAFKPSPVNGIPAKEFDQFIENQLSGKGNHTDYIERLSPAQLLHYQINKRALARLKK